MNHTPIEKEALRHLSLCVCRLFKSDIPPPSSASLLIYINKMKSHLTPTSKYNFPSAARYVWNRMLDADSWLNEYKK
jgi:hypothetical protein